LKTERAQCQQCDGGRSDRKTTWKHESALLVEEAARPRVPLQDDVVSFGLGEEIAHLQPRGPGAQHAVLVAAGAGVLVAVGKASQAANQDEGKDQTRKCRIHNLLDVGKCGRRERGQGRDPVDYREKKVTMVA